MNTGFLGPAVATVLTVYGIETIVRWMIQNFAELKQLQQCLPFTVLKPVKGMRKLSPTHSCNSAYRLRY